MFRCMLLFPESLMLDGYADQLERNNSSYFPKISHPLYLKAKLGQSRHAVETHVEIYNEIKKYILNADINKNHNWVWRDASLQDLEIRSRYCNITSHQEDSLEKSEDEINLLFVLFGQVRFPKSTLPEIKKWVENNFFDKTKKVNVFFALSTWEKTGARPVSIDDHIGFILPYFPENIASIITK